MRCQNFVANDAATNPPANMIVPQYMGTWVPTLRMQGLTMGPASIAQAKFTPPIKV
jgi:hypothetical protein